MRSARFKTLSKDSLVWLEREVTLKDVQEAVCGVVKSPRL
jgi:hypothetical protein